MSVFDTPPASFRISATSSGEASANCFANSSVSSWIALVFAINILILFSGRVVLSLIKALASASVISPSAILFRIKTISFSEEVSLI